MKDSVILGSGNSRYLKSVADFKTLFPTYDDFAAAMVAGTLPIDFNGINPAGFQQVGDPIGVSTLLKNATAALLGGDENMLPDEAFAALAAIASKNASAIEALTPHRTKIEIGSYVGAGTNSKTITFSFSPKLVILSVNSFGPCNSGDGWDTTKGVILTNSQRTVDLVSSYTSSVAFYGNNVRITSSDSNPSRAFDYSGHTYHYIAIG